MSTNALNPVLYDLLIRKFGTVKIASEGCPAYYQRIPDPFNPSRTIEQSAFWGEYYCVRCPFCNDHSPRLWINHLYASEVAYGRRQLTHLAVCYNNQCLATPGRKEQLEQIIFGIGQHLRPRNLPIKPVTEAYVAKPVTPPGMIVSLRDLPFDHPAIEYLTSRKFNPDVIADNFGVGVVAELAEGTSPACRGRLYIPVKQNDELLGWQCRGITPAQKPKYLNSPAMRKSTLLYNYDTAKDQPFVIVVEGVPSVWRLGAAAVCLFGKSMSYAQHNLIARTWHKKPVFLLLDNDAQQEMNQAAELLRRTVGKVITISLPDSRDPADYTFQEITDIVFARAEAEGVLSSMV
jgi:hypothetical protein